MKMFCISDSIDTAVGLKLAGIDYVILNKKEEIVLKLQEIVKDDSIGIIAITDNVYKLIPKEIENIEETKNIPLILRIPNSK